LLVRRLQKKFYVGPILARIILTTLIPNPAPIRKAQPDYTNSAATNQKISKTERSLRIE